MPTLKKHTPRPDACGVNGSRCTQCGQLVKASMSHKSDSTWLVSNDGGKSWSEYTTVTECA